MGTPVFDNIGVFYLLTMATCRIQNLKPPCGYNIEGVQRILLLDFDDFGGFRFDGDDLYNNCLVVELLRSGDYIELETPDSAKYSSALQNGVYAHTVETFIGDLSAYYAANLHLATKRRFIPVFHTKAGKYHTFGYEAGATLTYVNQTAEATGSLVTVVASSIYPLFEVTAEAITDAVPYNAVFLPDFDNAICVQTNG